MTHKIKKPKDSPVVISMDRLRSYAKKKPIFSFEYLEHDTLKTHKDLQNKDLYRDFLIRLSKLGKLGWDAIRTSHRHCYGREPIPIQNMKPQMPSCITPDMTHLDVFRADGSNHVFAGFIRDDIFFVVFIESNFGDLYGH